MYTKRYTADDEFPDCGSCHNTLCSKGEHCGPEYGWARYFRDETINLNTEAYQSIGKNLEHFKKSLRIITDD